MNIFHLVHEDIIKSALKEDLGHGHDITTQTLISNDATTKAVIRARENGVLAGVELAETVFTSIDSSIQITRYTKDGEGLQGGQEIFSISGSARTILTAERVALNFISHLSGIATQTAKYIDLVKGTKSSIVCTRKTLPGLRALQKYAVRIGGGKNHRFGLDDAILIKDNHIAIAGGIKNVLDQARNVGHMVKIEIEVDTLEQLKEVLDHGGADIVMLDNMSPDQLEQAVNMVDGQMITEASGDVNLETVRKIAESGVELISVGALTHSVQALDIGLDID